jgi:putative transposase
MPRKRHSAEEIVAKLRQADGLLAQGQTGADVARVLGVTETTYYHWRSEYGGQRLSSAKTRPRS